MSRLHLIEIHDQPWCPAGIRDAATDFLQFAAEVQNAYVPIADRLRKAIARSGASRVVDLCSGAGGPWRKLVSQVWGDGSSLPVVLTDRFPNAAAMERARAFAPGSLEYDPRPVDARLTPADLDGFRTLFASFHHFRPPEALRILADAVERGEGIGVFEVTHRSTAGVLLMALAPLIVLASMPFVRPFRWFRLLWTYLVPVLPVVILFDGVVSSLRTYSPRELGALTQALRTEGYAWEIGEEPSRRGPVPITYLIGYPTAPHGA